MTAADLVKLPGITFEADEVDPADAARVRSYHLLTTPDESCLSDPQLGALVWMGAVVYYPTAYRVAFDAANGRAVYRMGDIVDGWLWPLTLDSWEAYE